MRPFETGPEFSALIQPRKALPRHVRRRKLLLNKDVRTKVKVRPFEAGGEFSAPRCGSARTLWTPLDLGGVPGIPEFLKHRPPPLTWEVWRCEDCNRTFEGERQPFPQGRVNSSPIIRTKKKAVHPCSNVSRSQGHSSGTAACSSPVSISASSKASWYIS